MALAAVPAPVAAQELDADDPLVAEQPALEALRLPEAWATSTGEGVVIAVIDSGVDRTHPDLAGQVLTGQDVVGGTDREATADGYGSGTHVAGLAAATTGNGEGIAGAAPDARLLPVRVLDDAGRGDPEEVAEGITWAAEQGAGVIAVTVDGDPRLLAAAGGGSVGRAIRDAAGAGAVVVMGSVPGGGGDLAGGPVVLVGDGTEVTADPRTVTAPADGALSTAPRDPTTAWPDGTLGYEIRDGTAASTALVAGTAALLVAQGLTATEIADVLVDTAADPGGDPALGAGTVDAAAAVEAAASQGAGGVATPDPDGTGGGLAPAAVGGLAVGAALLAVGLTIGLAGRRPRRPPPRG